MSAGALGRNAQRHQAREATLQILYQWEIGGGDVERAVRTFFELQWAGSAPAADAVRTFASDLAQETVERLSAIDPLIADTTERWRPERMAVLDRLVLRMAVCEMMRDPSPPSAVIIDEAIELARTFSTEESVRFINGMLDGIRKKLEKG